MTPQILMAGTGACWLILMVVYFTMFAGFFKSFFSGFLNPEADIDESFKNFGLFGAAFIVMTGLITVDTIAFIGGFVWFLVERLG